ncbi:MAG TPA: hypothetical protein VG826_13710, partial [Pirellulales bacterium]|nr:hypothetical protein [Pirellulales bacterium]
MLTHNSPNTPHTTHVYLRVSKDGGHTWGDGTHVDDATHVYALTVDDGGDHNSPFLPSLSVNQSNGDVAIEWYDTRKDSDLEDVNVDLALYNPKSASFSQSVAVTAYRSNAEISLDSVSASYQFGNYTSLSFSGGFLHPAWATNASTSGGLLQYFSLATSAVAVAHVVAPSPVVRLQKNHATPHAAALRSPFEGLSSDFVR